MMAPVQGRMRTAPQGASTPLRGLTHSLDASKEQAMPNSTRTCAIDGCDRPARRREWCGAHYARHLRHGHPLAGGPDRQPLPEQCTIDGCIRKPHAYGLCKQHRKSQRRVTDPAYREKINAEWRDWAARNPDKAAEKDRRYRAENAERIAAHMKRWRAENRHLLLVTSWKRRRRLYGLPVDVVEAVDPAVVFERAGGVCRICGEQVDPDVEWPEPMSATVDHIIPVRDEVSTHSYANTQLAHHRCNQRKNANRRGDADD